MSPLFPYLYKDTGGKKKKEKKERKKKKEQKKSKNKLPYKVSKRVTAEASSEL